jgi:transposase-like protein
MAQGCGWLAAYAIYTANAIESLNSDIRKATKSGNYFLMMMLLKR